MLANILTALQRSGSSLVHEGSLAVGIESQVRSILAETLTLLGVEASELMAFPAQEAGFESKGSVLAQRDYNPAEPLAVGEMVFDLALPRLVGLLGRQDAARIAQVLHRAIWRRFPPAALGYVEALRVRLIESERAANGRLARELHDRIAHGILTGLQQVELARMRADGEELASAERILRATLDDTRRLAQDMRLSTAGRSLDEAIEDFVLRAQGEAPAIRFAVLGEPMALTEKVTAEVFAIVLEACRNARTHANGATEVVITAEWTEDDLVVSVVDDGDGSGTSSPGSGMGIAGMRERAAGIHARLEVRDALPGTAVVLTLPHYPFSERGGAAGSAESEPR